MADSVDLRFLGEQLRQVQTDVRQVRADQLRMESEQVQTQERLSRLEAQVEAFRETVMDRFDQMVELIKTTTGSLRDEIRSLKRGS